jgi:Rrf2 family protein
MPALQISRKMDYALRALTYLAGRTGAHGCTLNDIAAHTAVSSQFLAKIIEQLAQGGLVRSRRGPGGGYVLVRQPSEVSVNDVIEAVEGPVALNACTGGKVDCALLPVCGMTSLWREAQKRLVEVFSQTTLADVQMGPRQAGNGLSIADSGTRPMMGIGTDKGLV